MSRANLHSHHGGWKPWLNFGYLIVPVILFGVGLRGYVDAGFKEYEYKILGDSDWVWLSLLFALPVGAVFVCVVALLLKSNKDGDTDQFLKFCLMFMSFTPWFYLFLWCGYVHDWFPGWAQALSVLAFLLILVLVGLLIYTTYLIMWTPEVHSPLLNLSDVKERRWPLLRLMLKKYTEEASKLGSFSLLSRFRDGSLRNAILDGQSKYSKDDVIDELNGLLSDRDLREAQDFAHLPLSKESTDHLSTDHDWQVYNRSMFDEAYVESLNPRGGLHKVRGWLKKKVADRQGRLKAGVEKSSFWAMVFFFTIFLGITYLLALAFAFHDKATLLTEGKPAMFAPRLPLYNVGEYQHAAVGTAQGAPPSADGARKPGEAKAAGWPEYVFYFDNYSAMPVYRDAQFDQAEYDAWVRSKREHEQAVQDLRKSRNLGKDAVARLNGQRLSKEKEAEVNEGLAKAPDRWKQWKNARSLERLVEAIINEDSAQHGQGLLIQVRGSASDPPVSGKEKAGQNYPDNYSLSEARAQAVRYAVLKTLAEKGRLHGGLQWVLLPLSNETPSPGDGGRAQTDPVDEVEGEIAKTKLGDKTALTGRLSQLKRGREEKLLDEESAKDLAGRLRLYLNLLQGQEGQTEEERTKERQTKEGQTKEEKAALEVKKQHAADDFDETFKNLIHRYVDGDARKRVAVVSVRPAQQSPGSLFTPLSLMDYMYLTITGYDNIIPTTTYAKFLSSSTSILQIFFFVVFFNSLLSMKMNREAPAAEDAEHPSARRNGVDSRPVNNPQGIQLNGDVDMSEMKKTLDEVKTLLQQHRGWRKFLPF
jgi:hypothetical protein